MIKIWNFKRELIREIKFTEPISAVCFLNEQADLIVGHKGKLSRIFSNDYLPDPATYELPNARKVKKILKKRTIDIPENFFSLIKRQNDEITFLNDRTKKRA